MELLNCRGRPGAIGTPMASAHSSFAVAFVVGTFVVGMHGMHEMMKAIKKKEMPRNPHVEVHP